MKADLSVETKVAIRNLDKYLQEHVPDNAVRVMILQLAQEIALGCISSSFSETAKLLEEKGII